MEGVSIRYANGLGMPGKSKRQAAMMVRLTQEAFVPKDHPLLRIKPLADSALRRMSPLFDQI